MTAATTTGSSSSSTDVVSSPATAEVVVSGSLWKRSAQSAFRGGISGCIAMILQVLLLMWLRTVVNYQYKTGVGIKDAFQILYKEGGIPRFYRGLSFALIIGPISRFGDTAANEGINDLCSSFETTRRRQLPVWVVTFFAALVAAMWRVVITPLDTIKTTLQVSGSTGWNILISKISKYGIQVLWSGAFGNWLANLLGYYPWFVVNNWLEKRLPQPIRPPQRDNNRNKETKYQRSKLIRRAFIGLCSSFVSDCISNGIRVIKTYKQTSDVPITYVEAILELFHQSNNGLSFLYRGLELKLVCNCLSGILFSILWKMFMERLNNNDGHNNNAPTLSPSPILSTTNSSSIDNNSIHGQTVNDEEENIPLLTG